ncbi:hypothetical protein QJS10_CPA03g00719 [Acorus calamus]|uniref:Uncharacterized protein n=1 Tax=Acorus calamus TaxID=4465 RepID=A0AAV9F7D9_ACOCL|nr:hypothetical protein QJS10_CPA03g00719 [Acorus calamus]
MGWSANVFMFECGWAPLLSKTSSPFFIYASKVSLTHLSHEPPRLLLAFPDRRLCRTLPHPRPTTKKEFEKRTKEDVGEDQTLKRGRRVGIGFEKECQRGVWSGGRFETWERGKAWKKGQREELSSIRRPHCLSATCPIPSLPLSLRRLSATWVRSAAASWSCKRGASRMYID